MFSRDQRDILTHTQALPCDAGVSFLKSNTEETNIKGPTMALIPHSTREEAGIERLRQLEEQVSKVII